MNEPQQNGKPVSPFAQGYQMPPAYTPRPKEYYPLQKRDNIYAVLALIVGVILAWFGRSLLTVAVCACLTVFLAELVI